MPTMMEALPVAHPTEVTGKAQPRRFTAAEQLRVLPKAEPGEVRSGLGCEEVLERLAVERLGESVLA